MSRPRDTYKQRVYDAENAAFAGSRIDLPEMADLERYVEEVRVHPEVYDRYPRTRGAAFKVRDGRGRRSACASPLRRAIWMPRWSRKRHIVLHELAHVLDASTGEPGHGPTFVATYVHLVGVMLGEKARRRLVDELNARNVPFSMTLVPQPHEPHRSRFLVATGSTATA